MADTTSTADPVFDTGTAAGRLRILWGATANPQLAMSDDEVADVATVLDEHAEMAAELKQLRVEGDNPAADLAAFCEEWLKQNAGCDLIDHGFGAERGGELTVTKLRAVLGELVRLRAERDQAAPVMPDPRGPEHQRLVTDWHVITAIGFKIPTPDGDEWDVEYDIEHPDECDRLPYGEQCLIDRVIGLFGDDGQLGAEPQRARAHVYGPDMNGDFEEWIEWGKGVEVAADV